MESIADYRREVINNGKAYWRFVTDFINSHLYHDAADARSKNAHSKNMGLIEELLKNRQDLVRHYFNLSSFPDNLSEYILESLDNPNKVTEDNWSFAEQKQPFTVPSRPTFESAIDDTLLSLITDFSNEIQLFREQVSLSDLESLFKCRPVRLLTVRHNGLFAVFFDILSSNGFISQNWQRVFSVYNLVYSSSGKTFLSQKKLSAALYQFNMKKAPSVLRKIFIFFDHLKSIQITFPKE